jgi:hypothetical protein
LGNAQVAQSAAISLSIMGNVPAFCNSVSLTATTAGAVSFAWNTGQNTASISLGINNPDGLYTVTATNGSGCTASSSYFYQKQNLLNSYTIVALKSINLGESNTVNGSVGNTGTQATAINKNSTVNGFVRSSVINLSQPVTVTNGTFNSAATVTLPSALTNTSVTAGLPNLNLPDDYNGPAIYGNINQLTIGKRAKVTLNGNIFGKISIKESADVTFNANDISVDDISAENGKSAGSTIDYLTLNFANGATIRLKNTLKLGEKNMVNSNGATFYVNDNNTDAEKITINGRNTIVNANTYMLHGTMAIVNSDANNPCVMNGTHVDEIIKSSKNVTWSGFDCSASANASGRGIWINQNNQVLLNNTRQNDILVYPVPTQGIFYLQVGSSEKASIAIYNTEGIQIQKANNIAFLKGQPIRFDISNYPSGSYLLKVITENGSFTKQVIKIK